MASTHRNSPLGRTKLLALALQGFCIGVTFGYIFMSATQAVLEIGTHEHYSEEKVIRVASEPSVTSKLGASEKSVPVVEPENLRKEGVYWLDPKSARPISKAKAWPDAGNTIHVLLTSNGSPYLNIQTRIMYSTYKIAKQMAGGEKMVAFTRVLHRTKEDALMDEVPTYRVEPQNPQCDTWCEFPVADRPGAIRQFLEATAKEPGLIKAPWLLLIEADYVWKHPVKAPMAESSASAQGFPFGYIVPTHPGIEATVRGMYPSEKGDLNLIPGTGPAPVLLRVDELWKITPDWERLTYYIETTKRVKDTLGWVREMYAFSIATALQKVKIELKTVPENQLIVQPPADHELGEAAMYHYTWGSQFLAENGTKVFEFDKRVYVDEKDVRKVPFMPIPPPFESDWKLQDGQPVTQEKYDTIVDMLQTMNKGIATLPTLQA